MPELMLSFAVGSCLTFLAVNFNLYWIIRAFKKKQHIQINHNLQKVKKYWSLEQGQLVDIEPGKHIADCQRVDLQKSLRSGFIFGTLLIFLSWMGLFFFILYFTSVHWFAKSRFEKRLFSSNLATNELNADQISAILVEIQTL